MLRDLSRQLNIQRENGPVVEMKGIIRAACSGGETGAKERETARETG